MAPEDILVWTRRRPFEPFRIVVSDGSHYDIRHPELCMPGVNAAIVGLPRDPSRLVPERFEFVSMLHIVNLEPLEVVQPTKN
jgi:hypothetical protein